MVNELYRLEAEAEAERTSSEEETEGGLSESDEEIKDENLELKQFKTRFKKEIDTKSDL